MRSQSRQSLSKGVKMSVLFGKPQKPVSEHVVFENGDIYSHEIKGNETIVSVVIDGVAGVGKAVCAPQDIYSMDIGLEIARWRAVKNLAEQREALWISRAITKEDYFAKHPNKNR
jgi:hypothetical protein